MSRVLTERPAAGFLTAIRGFPFPSIIADEGENGVRRFIEFFTANIRIANTRQAGKRR